MHKFRFAKQCIFLYINVHVVSSSVDMKFERERGDDDISDLHSVTII